VCTEGGSVVNVVNSRRTLAMPEYRVRILRSRLAPTHVDNLLSDPIAYPGSAGVLASFQISVTNTGGRPLAFDQADRRVGLIIPNLVQQPHSISFPDLPHPPDGGPARSIADQSPIAPHHTAIGWVSFVAPAWTPQAIAAPGSELMFLPSHGGPETTPARSASGIRACRAAPAPRRSRPPSRSADATRWPGAGQRVMVGGVAPLVDCNVHLWDQTANPVFWLTDRSLVRDMLGN
jgi:hypothetical protein